MIFHAGREARTWVESSEYGVPFISSSDVQKASLSELPFISKKQVAKNPDFLVHTGYTLITRSGTIGKMAYCRSEMDGMACSEHVLRVVPDEKIIPPGYLYAFLSSKFGIPLVVAGTYGSIIQSIEPHHVADLPVPRFGADIEQNIHALIEEAAHLRSEANRIFRSALEELCLVANLASAETMHQSNRNLFCTLLSSELNGRLDANFHNPRHSAVLTRIYDDRTKFTSVGSLAVRIFEPARFKRIEHSDSKSSIPLFGTGDIGNVDPQPLSFITKFAGYESYAASANAVLIPRSGQLNGIIGTATLPIGDLRTGVVSEHAIRIECSDHAMAGYLFLALSTNSGHIQLKSRAFGGSIPTLDVNNVSSVLVPKLPVALTRDLGLKGFSVSDLRTQAIALERQARLLINQAIEST